MINVAVDAMGGDNAPGEIVKGAVQAVNKRSDIHILLVGQEEAVKKELASHTYPKEQITLVQASEVIETEEPPVNAIRRKKDSSIVVGMNLVKNGEADAFVSAGSSGAVLVGGQVLVGRIKGVERPPFGALIPTEKGVSLLLDCGANVDSRPSHLVQFARMGSIYMEHVIGISKFQKTQFFVTLDQVFFIKNLGDYFQNFHTTLFLLPFYKLFRFFSIHEQFPLILIGDSFSYSFSAVRVLK